MYEPRLHCFKGRRGEQTLVEMRLAPSFHSLTLLLQFQIPVEYRTACLSSLKTTDEAEVVSDTNSLSSSAYNHHSSDQSPLDEKKDTCQCAETDFCHWEDEEWSSESSWVDLIENPEQFTGYSGPGAHKVWRSIYEENCFGVARSSYTPSQPGSGFSNGIELTMRDSRKAAEAFSNLLSKQPAQSTSEQCLEKRVFYKIISGLHASISLHICHDYLDQRTGERKPNLQCFVERIAQHPERLQNIYFNHVVLTRALAKLAERLGMTRKGQQGGVNKDGLSEAQILSRLAPGLPISPTNHSLGRLLQQSLNSPPTFDEASMFDSNNPESEFLRKEFRDRFRNVSRIMDCVGCDKCRLWGKLQVNGLGTALKILFDGSHLKQDRLLQRSELVALVNTVHRISESIRAVETFRDMYEAQLAPNNQQERVEEVERHQVDYNKNNNNKTAQSSSSSSSSALKQTDSTSTGDSFLQRAKYVVNLGRQACESQWEKCLSWVLTLFDNSQSRSKSKTEL